MKRMPMLLTVLACTLLLFSAARAASLPLDTNVGGAPLKEESALSAMEYEDDTIHAWLEKDSYNGVGVSIIYVKIADPSQIRTAMSGTGYEDRRFVKTTLLSKKYNAVACVNGDYFKYNDFGYLVRQGETYRQRPDGKHDVLLIDSAGDFYALPYAGLEDVESCIAALPEGRTVVNSFNFGPILLLDGKAQPITTTLYSASDMQQRVAIVQLDTLEYAIVHCDGSYTGSHGLSMPQMGRYLEKKMPTAKIAYNLDGGGSAHICFMGKQVNNNDGGRTICDIIYFASAAE